VTRVRSERGMTLIELLIAMSLSLLLLGSTLAVFSTMERNSSRSQDQLDAQSEARVASELLALRLRNLASPTTTSIIATGLSIERATAQDLVFRSVKSTGTPSAQNPTNVQRDRFCLTGTRLYRQTQSWTAADPGLPTGACGVATGWTTTRVLAQHISNGARPAFTYLVSPSGTVSEQTSVDTTSTDAVQSVQSIRSDLFVDAKPNVAPRETELTSRLFLRNQNRKPVSDFSVTCTGVNRGVLLNGSASSDPEDGPLTFEWRDGGVKIGTGVTYTATSLSAGTHSFTLNVTDNSSQSTLSSAKTATIAITPTTTCSVP
jgi:prepilin-type N-terminal cleavage/methylation domain-containing protein